MLNQLCISESLDHVQVQATTKNNYPCVRAIYKKNDRWSAYTKLFEKHVNARESQLSGAADKIKELLTSRSHKQIILWGCGEDLIDILRNVAITHHRELQDQAKLVDINENKQGENFYGLEIMDPKSVEKTADDLILISTRSKLLQSEIKKYSETLFPSTHIISLYP